MAFSPILGSLLTGGVGSLANEGLGLISGIGEGIESLFGGHHHSQDTSVAHYTDGLSASQAYSPGAAVGMMGAFDSGSVQQGLMGSTPYDESSGAHKYSTSAKLGDSDDSGSTDPNGIDIY